ncbi:MAG: formyl transferase [Sphingobium sp.]|nr:formyl transferase [Sphingobium sp.]
MAHVLEADLNTLPVKWLADEPEFTFLADPFGWQENETFHLFAEQYDYRTRRGVIERLSFDAAGVMTQRQPVLAEDWHLSYPFIFEGEGAIWMLPEAHRSGRLTLYRAQEGLAEWRSECEIKLDCVPVDASILRHDGRWWLFYSPATNKMTKISHLHVAWADRLTGPWTPHPGNPVRVDKASARPGGTPVIINGRIMVPMQDCTSTYGGAIRPLWVDRLSDSDFSATSGDRLTAPPSAGAYQDGLHTLSACGDKTLLDVKRIDTSLRGMMVDIKRKLGGYNR